VIATGFLLAATTTGIRTHGVGSRSCLVAERRGSWTGHGRHGQVMNCDERLQGHGLSMIPQ
jgi:hypothetical protein